MTAYQKKACTGIVLPILFIFNSLICSAQSSRAITETEKKTIIQKVLSTLEEKYIFPEIVPSIRKRVTQNHAAGKYAQSKTAETFLKDLNVDLEALSNDRHVNVFFDPIRVKQIHAAENDTSTSQAFSPEYLQKAKFENFMIRKVERMDGNLGYLKFNRFFELEISKEAFVSALNLLSNSSALIIDLRQNGGGHSITTNFLLNYFLPDSSYIGDFKNRLDNTTKKIYTGKDPLIKKFSTDVPLLVLVSRRTSSAAEAFAYTLQASRRATIIGDTTNGEANPGYAIAINEEMFLMVPTFINRNRITNTNWQGTGVLPDVPVQQENALLHALAIAYDKLAKSVIGEELKSYYAWKSVGLFAELNPVKVPEKDLQTFAGVYADNRTITFEDGKLFYERAGGAGKKKLLPLTGNLFALEGASFFRVKFIKDKNRISSLEGMYDDGKIEVSKRIE